MNESEMREEIERLRQELAEVRHERDNLHKVLCSVLPVEEMDMTPEQFDAIRKAARSADDVLRDLWPAEMQHEVGERKECA